MKDSWSLLKHLSKDIDSMFALNSLIVKKHSRTFGMLLPNIVNISNGDFYMREYETVHEVMLHLGSLMDLEKHSDNERTCNPLDPYQLDEYLTIYSRGCCGFYDAMVFINPLLNKEGYNKNDSHPFLIGFNYNH